MKHRNFIVTLLGLVVLLLAPVIGYVWQAYYRDRMERDLKPAERAVREALSLAHEMRGLSLTYYVLESRASRHADGDAHAVYDGIVRDWYQETGNDRVIAACGPACLQEWRQARQDIAAWIPVGRRCLGIGHGVTRDDLVSQEQIAPANERFQRGIDALVAIRRKILTMVDELDGRAQDVIRLQALLTAPLALLCLLLAASAWRNMQRLDRASAAEREAAERLRLAVKETNHRVKNNLQVVNALVEMKRQEPGDAAHRKGLEEIGQQVRAMAAVHDFLSHEMHSDRVDGRRMLERLVALAAGPARLHADLACDALDLSVKQATAVSLLVNELLLNAGKHGATRAQVTLRCEDALVRLCVTDDGPGFPADFQPERDANLGVALVQTLAQHDLEGEARFENNGGAAVEVTFPRVPAEAAG